MQTFESSCLEHHGLAGIYAIFDRRHLYRHTHTYIHAHAHTQTHTHMNTHTHTQYIYIYIYICIQFNINIYIQSYIYIRTYLHTHTHIHSFNIYAYSICDIFTNSIHILTYYQQIIFSHIGINPHPTVSICVFNLCFQFAFSGIQSSYAYI